MKRYTHLAHHSNLNIHKEFVEASCHHSCSSSEVDLHIHRVALEHSDDDGDLHHLAEQGDANFETWSNGNKVIQGYIYIYI